MEAAALNTPAPPVGMNGSKFSALRTGIVRAMKLVSAATLIATSTGSCEGPVGRTMHGTPD